MMDNPIERAFEFARLLGFNGNDNIKRLLRFFKQVEAKELTQMSGPLRALLRQVIIIRLIKVPQNYKFK